ncbi:hypothetical protein [Paraburkholderia graminis]|uniref:hypothetical protein n=1 Tax=Paraburkholderia graminis TaxID=60548 RepID=UPI001290565E|nr:hypothetical protein [Paraburkholderia graminis]
MSLYDTWTALCDEFDLLVECLRDFTTARSSISASADFVTDDECLLEGVLSRLWQAWAIFCRSCVIESCLGTIDGAGVNITPHPQAATEPHVSGAAINAKKKPNPPFWGPTNTVLRYEPTWGDVDSLTKVIPRLQPSNEAQLMAAFSSAHRSAKALQLIRNAAAHNNLQTRADLLVLWSRFMVFPTTHPIQSLYWVEPSTRDYLVFHAVEELRDAALAAIS